LARLTFLDETRGGSFAALFPLRPHERLLFGGFTFEERWRLLLSDAGVEEDGAGPAIFLNPLSIPDASLAREIRESAGSPRAWFAGERPVAGLAGGERGDRPRNSVLLSEALRGLPARACSVRIVERPWDLIAGNAERIREDAELVASLGRARPFPLAGGPESGPEDFPELRAAGEGRVSFGEGARVEPFVFADASGGPIRAGARVVIEAHAVLRGPIWIRDGARVKSGARIGPGTTVGEASRVAGEIEETVFGAFSNKQHEGFLGHAYVGEWVNLGAGTNNSDLKNNYGTVRIDWGEGPVDTGLRKLGCFLGDHVKSAIGTRIGTGAVVGAASNLFGSSGLVAGHIPPFTWGEEGGVYEWGPAVDTMKRVLERRREELARAGRRAGLEAAEVERLKRLWEARKGGRP
jgi:UDP-N-acetylglucosamine diphosphorylase/glucosamine-1-phosphate N-acetyltransferase